MQHFICIHTISYSTIVDDILLFLATPLTQQEY
jgi:hypothetical protein